MVQAYWLIGREIVEVEQHDEKRAGYGARVVEGRCRESGAAKLIPIARRAARSRARFPRASRGPRGARCSTAPERRTSPRGSFVDRRAVRSYRPRDQPDGATTHTRHAARPPAEPPRAERAPAPRADP
ncbi:MAG: hypothetical protein WCJ30_04240 [Deltaproteobacteria bacterium]